jgi:pimeloyl-ACP methyl ester carboxylesterase
MYVSKTILFSLFVIFALTTSCRLDSFLFSPLKATEYKLDDFENPPHFRLDSTYAIADSLVSLMALESGPQDNRATIYAVYIGDVSRISQDTVILYCHGNAGNIDYYWERAKLLANAGGKNRFGVMFMDYRGYGMSTGEATELGMYYDVEACMEWLKSNGLTSRRFIMEGFSLGCAPATELTANPRTLEPEKLILEAPFASFDFMVQDIAKLSVPGSLYANLEVDNAEEIKKVQQPFLWMHGIADSYVGIHHGELVAQNYQGTKIIKRRVAGAEHSLVPPTMGFDLYMKLIVDFITGRI